MNFQNGNLDQASRMFSRASKIALIGNGGNLSVAQHRSAKRQVPQLPSATPADFVL